MHRFNKKKLGCRRVHSITIWIELVKVHDFTKFIVDLGRDSPNIKVFVTKAMLGLTTVLPNPPVTTFFKPKTCMNRYPFMLKNMCGDMPNRFTNICEITLSTLIFINKIVPQRRRNLVFVLKEAPTTRMTKFRR